MANIGRAPLWVELASTVIPLLPLGRYRAMNWVCRRPPPTFFMRMPAALGGSLFMCDLRDTISREVCFTGSYEPLETLILQKVLRPGMTFVDVGANWGYFSLLGSHIVGRTGRVIALEPDPRTFAALQSNISRNSLDNVTVKQVAAADRQGTCIIAGYSEEDGNFGVTRLVDSAPTSGVRFQAQTETLDSLLHECGLDKVDLVKIDVEGAEDLVLAGMQAGLQQARYTAILLELHPSLLEERGKKVEDAIQRLVEATYTGWSIDHSPRAVKEAAYGRMIYADRFLKPFNQGDRLDAWPHTLWSAPGLEFNVCSSITQ
ncbi:MAG TPA: FkbM family methyltransferase [Candidatus Saccharimonadales bacterium]|jgi:FkbM family methyltransferase|nr:FkbM family methyltransferase [Candidatus Saccharimonadales bacterium]